MSMDKDPEKLPFPDAEAIARHREFLAKLRHELRTPLNAIIGYSEMLIEDFEDEGYADLVSMLLRLHSAGQDLLHLVNESLDAAKIDAGELDIDLPAVQAELSRKLDAPAMLVLEAGEMGLLQARNQGLDEFVPDLEKIGEAGKRFVLLIDEISDAQALPSGGDWKDREQSTVLADDAAATLRRLQKSGGELPEIQGAILVVDDNEMNRDVLSRHLARQGHSVAQAENGHQALVLVDSQPFDLVLLDVMMPEMDGYQVLQRLKSEKNWRDIPVIMISALDELQSIVRCIELGAEDYLPKPFDPVLLKARIDASLEKKRLRDQEVEYLRNVALVTEAAAAVELETASPEELGLERVADRPDALGQLARVFQAMAREVYAREQRLKQQVHELTIELDEAKQTQQVEEIMESDYFQQLEASADELRNIMDGL